MASAVAAAASSTARMIRVDALMYLRPSHVSLIAVKASSLPSNVAVYIRVRLPAPAGLPAGWLALSGGAGTVALATFVTWLRDVVPGQRRWQDHGDVAGGGAFNGTLHPIAASRCCPGVCHHSGGPGHHPRRAGPRERAGHCRADHQLRRADCYSAQRVDPGH